MISVEPEHDLVLDDPAVTADVVVLLCRDKAYVTLAEIVLLVVYNKDRALVKGVVKVILYLIKFYLCLLCCKFGHLTPELIIVDIHLVEPEVCPVEVSMLHAVFAEGHLHAVIELAGHRGDRQKGEDGQERY